MAASDMFSDITSKVLVRKLDAQSARQRAIANNIANVETPGYKRTYVTFEDQLQQAMNEPTARLRRQGVEDIAPNRCTDFVSPCRPDGNNVNIDQEVADLAKSGLEYRAATVLLQGKSSMLRAAVTEGKQ